ncbi:MAG TPA: ABC transporter ATP-binding protein [Mycobacteriales bacterium]|jgi:ABC-2 type transport system ATP-binding protein|nr:ABC transporter ATP-binding protein [Mycobacteriales bacterium]
MTPAVEVDAVSRSFGSADRAVRALDAVSFTVEPGSVLAVLGANGAGKTTLTKILATLVLPSAGTARILGHDVVREPLAVRAVTSVVFGGDRGLYTRLTGRANLRFFAMLAGVRRRELTEAIPAVLAEVGLTEAADRRVETYSKGMRQRLHIAIGVITRPRVLLLDEPTVGLDPLEAQRLRGSVRQMRDAGTAVLLTSHYLLDVEELADRVLLLDRGRVVHDGPLAAFAAQSGYAAVVEVQARGPLPDLARLLPGTAALDRIDGPDENGWRATLRLRTWGGDVFRELADLLESIDVLDVQVRPARLEEAYARLSSGPAR